MEKGQFVTVSEWMTHGNIVEYIKHNHTNRLELVRPSLSPPLPSLNCDDSCMGQLRVWSTSMEQVTPTGISKWFVSYYSTATLRA